LANANNSFRLSPSALHEPKEKPSQQPSNTKPTKTRGKGGPTVIDQILEGKPMEAQKGEKGQGLSKERTLIKGGRRSQSTLNLTAEQESGDVGVWGVRRAGQIEEMS